MILLRFWRLSIRFDTDCQRCALNRRSPGHTTTVADCNMRLALDNRTCASPPDHHRFRWL